MKSGVGNAEKIQRYWQQNAKPYLLIEQTTLNQLHLDNVQQLGNAKGWLLVTQGEKPAVKTVRAIVLSDGERT